MRGHHPSSQNGTPGGPSQHQDSRHLVTTRLNRAKLNAKSLNSDAADRHPYSEGEGRTFESCRVRQCFQLISRPPPCFREDRGNTGITVDEQPLAGGVYLSHGRRQPRLPTAVQLAPAAVAVIASMGGSVFFLKQQKCHSGAAQLAMDRRLGRLRLEPLARFEASKRREQQRFKALLSQRLGSAHGNRPVRAAALAAEYAIDLVLRSTATLGPLCEQLVRQSVVT